MHELEESNKTYIFNSLEKVDSQNEEEVKGEIYYESEKSTRIHQGHFKRQLRDNMGRNERRKQRC